MVLTNKNKLTSEKLDSLAFWHASLNNLYVILIDIHLNQTFLNQTNLSKKLIIIT